MASTTATLPSVCSESRGEINDLLVPEQRRVWTVSPLRLIFLDPSTAAMVLKGVEGWVGGSDSSQCVAKQLDVTPKMSGPLDLRS